MLKSAKIESTVLARLNAVKGKDSVSDYIDCMLTYFEVTGASPKSLQTHPSQVVANGLERIIKIIKAIEKEKINPLLQKVEEIGDVKLPVIIDGMHQVADITNGIPFSGEDNLSAEDIQRLSVIHQELQSKADIAEQENKNLRKEIESLKSQIQEANHLSGDAALDESTRKQIRALLESTKQKGQPDPFNSEKVTYFYRDIVGNLKQIESLLTQ